MAEARGGAGARSLPAELVMEVFRFLEWRELVAVSRVCSAWRRVARDPFTWRELLRRRFPDVREAVDAFSAAVDYRRAFMQRALLPSSVVQTCRHGDEVLDVHFSPCGTLLASCSRDRTCKIWSVKASMSEACVELLMTYEGGETLGYALFSPNSRYVAVSAVDTKHELALGSVTIIDVVSQSIVRQLRSQPSDSYMVWTADSSAVVVSSKLSFSMLSMMTDIQVVRVDDGIVLSSAQIACQHNYTHWMVAPSSGHRGTGQPASSWIAMLSGTTSQCCDSILVYDFANETLIGLAPVQTIVFDGCICAMEASPSGTIVVNLRPFVDGDRAVISTHFEIVEVDPLSGATLSRVRGQHRGFTDIQGAFIIMTAVGGLDGRVIATGSEDNNCYLYSVGDAGAPLRTLCAHTAVVNSVTFHPRIPNLLVTGSDDNSFKVWL